MNNFFVKLSKYRKELEQSIQAKEYSNVLNKINHLLDEFSSETETKKHETEFYYKKIFENSLSGFGITNFNGDVIDCNPALLKMLDFSSLTDFKKHKLQEFYGDPSQRSQLIGELKKNGFVKEFKLKVKTLENKNIIALVNANVVNSGEDEPIIVVNFEDITEKVKQQEDLRESEKYLDIVFNSVNSGILLIDPDTHRIVDLNEYALNMFMQKKDDVVGRECYDLICQSEKGKCPITDLNKTVEDSVCELVVRRGGNRYILKNVKKIEIKGKPLLLETFSNIDKQVEYENELKQLNEGLEQMVLERTKNLSESEEKFKALFQSSRDAIVLVSTEGFFKCNDAALKLFGYNDKNEFLKLHPADISPEFQLNGENSLELSNKYIEEAFNHKVPIFEWVHKKKDGQLFPCEILLSPINIGNTTAIQAVIRDVSERKENERRLRKSEEKFRVLSDLSPAGICIVTIDSYLYVNKSWCDLTEYTEEDSRSLNPLETVHPDMRDLVRKRPEERLKGENATTRYDIKIVTKSGIVKWIDIAFTIINYDGRFATLAIMNDITVMKAAQEELKLSEEKFRMLSDLSPSAISIQRGNKYFYVNSAWSEITGYRIQEINKIGPYDIIHPEMRVYVKELSNQKLKKEGAKHRYDLKIITKDKKVKWLDIIITTIKYENRNASFAICNDITEIREMQQTLIDSEKKFRSLIENLRQEYFFYRHNTEGVFEYVSPSVENILGYSTEEFLTSYDEFYTDNPINNIAHEKTKLAMQGIEQLPYELEIYDIQKNKHILEISEAPIVDTEGNVLAVEGIAHDITSRKKAEKIIQGQLKEIQINNEEIKSINEELKALNDDLEVRLKEIDILNKELSFSKTKYETLVKNIPGIVFRCRIDKEWTMEYLSDEVELLTGYKASDFILNNTRSYASIIHSDDRKRVEDVVIKDIKEFNYYSVEYRLVNSNGDIVWVYERGQHFIKGKKKLINGVVLDISDKKKVEEKLIQSEQELRKLNAQKDKFFSLLAHDLRSPVGNFLQISELLKLKYEDLSAEQAGEFFDSMYGLADRTFKLLENLLMWSRSQLGRLEIEPQKIELKKVLDDVIYLLEENLRLKKIHFQNNIPEELAVTADLNVVQTLFRNLIGNAIKFSFEGGIITVSCNKGGKKEIDKYIISITDNGVGIPAEKVDKIFNIDEDYSTLGTKSEKGTGLGLILCKDLINKIGEEIWLESKEGMGTTFYFTLSR